MEASADYHSQTTTITPLDNWRPQVHSTTSDLDFRVQVVYGCGKQQHPLVCEDILAITCVASSLHTWRYTLYIRGTSGSRLSGLFISVPASPNNWQGSMSRAPVHNAAFLKGPKILDNNLARLKPCYTGLHEAHGSTAQWQKGQTLTSKNLQIL